MFLTYYRARGRPFSGYTAFLDVLSFSLSLFSSVLFLCLWRRYDLFYLCPLILCPMVCARHAVHSRCSASPMNGENAKRAQWHRNVRGRMREREKERELVRRKDNRTIKSQIRGQLVLGRVSRGCRKTAKKRGKKYVRVVKFILRVMKHRDI